MKVETSVSIYMGDMTKNNFLCLTDQKEESADLFGKSSELDARIAE